MLSGIEINKELARRFERWLIVQQYAEATQAFYNRAVRHFTKFMGRTMVTKATAEAEFESDCSAAVVRRTRAADLYSLLLKRRNLLPRPSQGRRIAAMEGSP
jgi:hypothetical protein